MQKIVGYLILFFNYSRFIINLSPEEQNDMIRVFFKIEEAHWFYIDFYCREDRVKPGKKISIKDFAIQNILL